MTHVSTSTEDLKPHERYVPASHWRNAYDEADGAKLGMWLFLSTEILLFAGFFCAYAVFRMLYPGVWADASHYYLDWRIGGFNTLVLLLSSFTVVLAIRGAQTNRPAMTNINLIITIICALVFLVLKLGWEYYPKWVHDELPGGNFAYHSHSILEAGGYVPGSHDNIFLSIYWIATGTHGVHVLIGAFLLTWCLWLNMKGFYGPKHYTSLENVGLYWHIVDIIWIFLFPLLYLV